MFPHSSSKKVKNEVIVDIGDAPNGLSMFLDVTNLLASDLTDSEKSYKVFTDNSKTVADECIIAVTGDGIKNSEEVKKGYLTSPGSESEKCRAVTEEKYRFNTSTTRCNSFPSLR